MRFLIDNALSPQVARLLCDAGHQAVHVRDYGLQTAPDPVILDRANSEDRVLVSADSDFTILLATRSQAKPSFILFREPDIVRPEAQALYILESLSQLEKELNAGCVVTFRRGRIRVRALPFSGNEG